MKFDEPTVAIMRAEFSGTAMGTALEYTWAQDHSARTDAVQAAVDFACNELELNKHTKQNLNEDQLTIEICSFLSALGFQPRHDEQIGGHCDIVIRGCDSFLWLAEAKLHSSYDWLKKGFQQLSTRYSTGVIGQDNGEVLIYCFNQDALAMLQRWRKELQNRNSDVSTEEHHCGNPLTFCSKHQHASSGLEFIVRHKAVALFWKPEDK